MKAMVYERYGAPDLLHIKELTEITEQKLENFEKNVKYLFDFTPDKLVIGKFCMIASDVKFIMNGANHLTTALSAHPFAIFGKGWESCQRDKKRFPEDTIERLLKLKWWNWNMKKITKNLPHLTGMDIDILEQETS